MARKLLGREMPLALGELAVFLLAPVLSIVLAREGAAHAGDANLILLGIGWVIVLVSNRKRPRLYTALALTVAAIIVPIYFGA